MDRTRLVTGPIPLSNRSNTTLEGGEAGKRECGGYQKADQTLSRLRVDNRNYQERKYPALIYNRDGQTTCEYMTVGGHVVSNKWNNCLENFRVFHGTRRFFDAGLGRHRNRRF